MIVAILQFMQAKGAGEASLRRFLSFAMRNGEANALLVCSSAQELTNELKLKPEVSQSIVDARPLAQSIASKLVEEKVSVTWFGDNIYPLRLLEVLQESSPPVLFYKGNPALFKNAGVGFCGSRKASNKGLIITRRCAEQLVQRQICVVSGYAYGVDMAAHRAALENAGTTIFVLVDGILRFKHKKEVMGLLSDENYLAVSQFPPNMSWSGINAMKRNGTIIGLSKAMILVESGVAGGTFAAGEETLKRHEPLFVIDFAAPGPSAEANPHFIQKGGVPIRGNQEGIPNLHKVFAAVEAENLVGDRRHELLRKFVSKNDKTISSQQGNLL